MKIFQKIFSLTIVLCSLSFMGLHLSESDACAGAKPLKTETADPVEIKGTFTVIFYGGAYADDLETVAILDTEGDQYSFEPFAPDFDYVTKKGLSAGEALAAAEKFIRFHPSFWRTQLIKIIDPEGKSIGFELKPLYIPFIYGTSDVLDVYYWPKKEGKIKVTIKLKPSLETLKFHPGGDGGFGGGH
jgi:hypothetical protein